MSLGYITLHHCTETSIFIQCQLFFLHFGVQLSLVVDLIFFAQNVPQTIIFQPQISKIDKIKGTGPG